MRFSLAAVLAITSLGVSVGASPLDRRDDDQSLGDLAGKAEDGQGFDYVIVGAGTAGLAMAARLSEDSKVTVAVIEAGTFYQISNPLLSDTPAGDVVFCGSSPLNVNQNVDWNFVTSPQAGAADRKVHYARGKCLGGSSARNFMIYQRGTKQSYQKWADAVGDQSYSWDNFLPYFKRSINFTPPNTSKRAVNATGQYEASAFDSGSGPLQVSYANYAQVFSSFMEGGLNEIGISKRAGFNNGELFGTAYCASTIDPTSQTRSSSATSYLNAAKGRSNLKVFQMTMAKKIVFDSDKRATAVNVQSGWFSYTIKARREVIVSAGAFQSPQMLMVSGIGPAATLNGLGIQVLVDNPNVGQNMWDHVFAGPSYRVGMTTITKVANDLGYLFSEFFNNFVPFKNGPLTNPVADFLAWEKVPASLRSKLSARARQDLAQFPADWPELEYISGAGYVGDFADLLFTQPKDGYQYATILSTLVAPLSRGNVTITSKDTNVPPVINPNWLTHPTDQEVAVAAYKRARQAFASNFMKRVVIGDEYFPGPKVQTDAQILDTYRKTVMTVWHAACTCKMGKLGDPTAVLDPQARVLGVQGLRVVDASSFPLLPPGHPQSTIYALAEKIADDIKKGN